MREIGRRAALGIALIAALGGPGVAAAAQGKGACAATGTAQRLPLVELYTSEGCDSCPPADRWLSTLRGRSDLVALAFHVDYWDGLGWADRFASPRHTARQKWLAQFGTANFVYTPEVAVNGHEWRAWGGSDPVRAAPARNAAPVLSLQMHVGTGIEVEVHAQGDAGHGDRRVFVALWQDGLVSQVRAGENRGATLHHDRVVRAMSEALDPAAAHARFALPPEFDPAQAGVAAFLQDMQSGEVLQALSAPLGAPECVE